MRTQAETEMLVDRLEAVLTWLTISNRDPHGACCSCLQDVPNRGLLPGCHISQALKAIEEWRD